MIGADGVVDAVTARMREPLREVVGRLREKRGLDVWALPDPAEPEPYMPDVSTLGEFPAILISYTGVRQEEATLTAPEPGVFVETYEFIYDCEVYALCRGTSRQDTERQTRLYEQALRTVLLSRKNITPEQVGDGEALHVMPTRVRSTVSDVVPVRDNRFVSAVVVEVPVKVHERVGSPFPSSGDEQGGNVAPVHPAFE